MNNPRPKYQIRCYRFGEILSQQFIWENSGKCYWKYMVLKRGTKHPQLYFEDEVEVMDKAANILTVY